MESQLFCRRLATAGSEALNRWGLPPTPPHSASSRRLATAGNKALGRRELPPPHLRFQLRSACLVDGSLPRATRRLTGGLPPPHPRFPLRTACLVDGSLPRATKRLPSFARTCEVVRLFAVEARNDETLVVLIAAAVLANSFIEVGENPPNSPSPLCSASTTVGSLLRATNAAITVTSNFSRRMR
jgi:hypothetical protein